MLIELSILNQLPVGSFDEGGLIGKVLRTIISRKDGRVLGFVVKKMGFFGETKIASFEDIISIDQVGIVIRSSESLVDKEEIIRIGEILKEKFDLIGLKAVAKNKANLGRVADALVNTDTGDIMRVYVKKFFKDYVFEHSQIEEITLKNIVLHIERKEKAKKPIKGLAQAEVA
jgi:sporulation protein YlmC with PRC-barrel domain